MRRIALVAAAFAVVTAVTPAGANDVVGGGLGCGFYGTQPTGSPVVNGEVFGGPWYAPPTHPDATVEIRCVVQTVQDNMPPQVVADVHSARTPGYAILPPTPVLFPKMPAAATIEVCTEVTVYWDQQPHYFIGDADHDPSNGAQCDDAWEDDDQAGHIYVDPPDPNGGDLCAYVEHPYYPPVPKNYCVPY